MGSAMDRVTRMVRSMGGEARPACGLLPDGALARLHRPDDHPHEDQADRYKERNGNGLIDDIVLCFQGQPFPHPYGGDDDSKQ